MKLQKLSAICLSLGFALSVGAGVLPAFAEETPAEEPVRATTVNKENAELFLPESYEQYLPLTAPSDADFSERYIAVADGKTLYLYGREQEQYVAYTHPREIKKIQFSDDGRLFFSDSTPTTLYEFDAERLAAFFPEQDITEEAEEAVKPEGHIGIPSGTFVIYDDYIYTAAISTLDTYLYYFDLKQPFPTENIDRTGTLPSRDIPQMTCLDNILYCVASGSVYTYSVGNGKFDRAASESDFESVSSICALGDSLYYTKADGVYRTSASSLKNNSRRIFEGEGFTALAAYDGILYGVRNQSVLALEVTGETAHTTGYEIAASSPSLNRWAGATQSVRSGGLLVTADANNSRVSVFNLKKGGFTVIDCGYIPSAVATDGTMIAVAEGDNIDVYRRDAETDEITFAYRNTTNTAVMGLACVYGRVYFVTQGFGYGYTMENDFNANTICFRTNGQTQIPVALTCDLYGNLYVARADGSVYAYTEEQFIDKSVALGELRYKLPENFTHSSLRSDFEGNLYCLAGSVLYQNNVAFATVDAQDCVFGATSSTPLSFALGFEDNAVYFNYGDYAVKTTALTFPTLGNISSERASEKVFRLHGKELLKMYDIKAGAVRIQTDISELRASDSEYFEYVKYERLQKDMRGILLAEVGKYSLVALFGADHRYTANLFLTEKYCSQEVAQSEYWEDKKQTLYLTSDVSTSLFPCMGASLHGQRLERKNGKVTLLGIVRGKMTTDYEYALIEHEFETESGAVSTVQGYVPLTFLTNAVPLPEQEVFRYGYLQEGIELICGGIAIVSTPSQRAALYQNDDGTYIARIDKDGNAYLAVVTESQLVSPVNDALRISLIVILSVLAVIIVGAYCYLRGKKPKKVFTAIDFPSDI